MSQLQASVSAGLPVKRRHGYISGLQNSALLGKHRTDPLARLSVTDIKPDAGVAILSRARIHRTSVRAR